jgi:peptidyl-prolyl cis-trans isomerase C
MLLQPKVTFRTVVLACMLVCGAVAPAAAHPPLPPVALVNGQPIERSSMGELLKLRATAQSEPGRPYASTAQDRQRALDDLIRMELVTQQATALGLTNSAPVQADLDYQRKNVLTNRLTQHLTDEMQVGDPEVQARYDAIPAESEFTVRQIALKSEASALQVIRQLDGGASFAALARKLSTDRPSALQGGLLAAGTASSLPPFVVEAAQALQPNTYTRQPIKTEMAWYVIQLQSRKALPKAPLEKLSQDLRAQLIQDKVQALLDRWYSEAKIEVLQTLDDKPLRQPSGVVARVNGQEIPRVALEQIVNVRNGIQNPYGPEPIGAKPAAPVQGRESILQELLHLEVLAQKAVEMDLEKNSSVKAEVQLQVRALTGRLYMRHIAGQTKVEPDEIKALYETEMPPLAFKVSQIVLPERPDALEVIEALDKGASFTALARAHSTDKATRARGGDMGWHANSEMKPELAAATRGLKMGQHSKAPVQSEDGWHVLLLQASRPAARPEFAAVSADLQATLMQRKIQAQVQRLRSEATIEILK